MLACPNTKAATGALEDEVELPNMPPPTEVAGALELEELLFKKLKTDLKWSRGRSKLRQLYSHKNNKIICESILP